MIAQPRPMLIVSEIAQPCVISKPSFVSALEIKILEL